MANLSFTLCVYFKLYINIREENKFKKNKF